MNNNFSVTGTLMAAKELVESLSTSLLNITLSDSAISKENMAIALNYEISRFNNVFGKSTSADFYSAINIIKDQKLKDIQDDLLSNIRSLMDNFDIEKKNILDFHTSKIREYRDLKIKYDQILNKVEKYNGRKEELDSGSYQETRSSKESLESEEGREDPGS